MFSHFRKSLMPVVVASSAFALTGFTSITSAEATPASEPALSPKEYRTFKLLKRETLTPNTKIYRFAFENEAQKSGLPVASCLMAKFENEGKTVARPYTPVSVTEQEGHVDLLIKTYPAPGGVMSRHIDDLKVGETLDMKGPFMKLAYKANMKKKIAMIAGGTGITPMLQVIREVLSNIEDDTQLSLVFANVTEADIILRDELEALQFLHGEDKFKIYYTLDKPPRKWVYGTGFVSEDMLKENLGFSADEEDVLVLVCGPKGFMTHVSGDKGPKKTQGEVEGLLKTLGFKSEQVFKF